MDKTTLQEIAAIWDKIGDIEHKQSNYTAARVEAVTPYTETKTAYIGDTEVTFSTEEKGSLSIYAEDTEGNSPDYVVSRTGSTITVNFKPLEFVTTVTISIFKEGNK